MKNKDKAYWLAKKAKAEKKIKELDKPVDGFYFNDNWDYWMTYSKDGVYQFGIISKGVWCSDIKDCEVDEKHDTLATESEVTTRLTEFVKSLGYKEGVEVELGTLKRKSKLKGEVRFSYSEKLDRYAICFGSDILWRSNKKGWAKIVEKLKCKVENKVEMPRVTKISSWASGVGSQFYLTVEVSNVTYEDHKNNNDLAKRLETFLNSEQC